MRKPPLNTDARGQTGTKLLVAMTGKASAAKAAEGDEPVFAYIASLPQPQRSIAERSMLWLPIPCRTSNVQ